MKNLLLILMLFWFSVPLLAQQSVKDSSGILNKETLLLKSKKQKKAANILLISGGSLILISGVVAIGEVGAIVVTEGENLDNIFSLSSGIATVGILMSVASVPFYISAGRNKRKAASLSFQQQKIPYIKNNSVASSMIPAVSIKIKF